MLVKIIICANLAKIRLVILDAGAKYLKTLPEITFMESHFKKHISWEWIIQVYQIVKKNANPFFLKVQRNCWCSFFFEELVFLWLWGKNRGLYSKFIKLIVNICMMAQYTGLVWVSSKPVQWFKLHSCTYM